MKHTSKVEKFALTSLDAAGALYGGNPCFPMRACHAGWPTLDPRPRCCAACTPDHRAGAGAPASRQLSLLGRPWG